MKSLCKFRNLDYFIVVESRRRSQNLQERKFCEKLFAANPKGKGTWICRSNLLYTFSIVLCLLLVGCASDPTNNKEIEEHHYTSVTRETHGNITFVYDNETGRCVRTEFKRPSERSDRIEQAELEKRRQKYDLPPYSIP